MTETDFDAFETAYRRLSGVYALKARPSEMQSRMREYFDALRGSPIADVLAAAQTCRNTLKHFPKIVEWRTNLPTPDTAKPEDARWMTHSDALEYVRAERQCWHADPCDCLECQAADMTDRRLRYVPEFDRDDHEVAVWCGLKHELVVQGHWAHGIELARWYAARDRFMTTFGATLQRNGIEMTIAGSTQQRNAMAARRLLSRRPAPFVNRDREPGEEG